MEQQGAAKPGLKRSVWDFPRPPRLEQCEKPLRVVFNGETVAETTRGAMVLETSHPPVYYFPAEDVRQEFLQPACGASYCEWKGSALYFTVQVKGKIAQKAAWSYPNPTPAYAPIKGYFAFYAGAMDVCYVGEEAVTPQDGGFYGGWITEDVEGPFKIQPGLLQP